MVEMKLLIEMVKQAGTIVLSIYNENKTTILNNTAIGPLTNADIQSHNFISESLQKLYPHIPILSEESAVHQSYDSRKKWDYFFLVDPLDGTKEFVKRNGEFTINVALIKKNKPILGIIHAPVFDVTYYAEEGSGAYKMAGGIHQKLLPRSISDDNLRVVVSKSHCCADTKFFLEKLKSNGKTITEISKGSALKFGLIAENSADIYPRFAPTMEWDTAAGQILVSEVGKKVKEITSNQELSYNKLELVNPGFVVE